MKTSNINARNVDLSGAMKLRTGHWKLSDLKKIKKNGLNVFSCFHCGGGSSMGYKLAGFNVLGGVEIDPKMMDVYRANHHPVHSFLMGVQEFNKIPKHKIPKELFDLDVLDGSPPCSSFSTAGSREKAWQTKKKFREGQAEQVLDDLFFHFIETAKKLNPKIVVAENVKGLIVGNARGYVKEIFRQFDSAGYDCQLFLLNAGFMGVPQLRERTFFIARRKDLNLPKINLKFNEKPIPFSDIKEKSAPADLGERLMLLWKQRRPSDNSVSSINQRLHGKISGFTMKLQRDDRPLYTITASDSNILYSEPRRLTDSEVICGQTFPQDFDFRGLSPKYICGMSVPPFMMQRIADQIFQQWFKK